MVDRRSDRGNCRFRTVHRNETSLQFRKKLLSHECGGGNEGEKSYFRPDRFSDASLDYVTYVPSEILLLQIKRLRRVVA